MPKSVVAILLIMMCCPYETVSKTKCPQARVMPMLFVPCHTKMNMGGPAQPNPSTMTRMRGMHTMCQLETMMQAMSCNIGRQHGAQQSTMQATKIKPYKIHLKNTLLDHERRRANTQPKQQFTSAMPTRLTYKTCHAYNGTLLTLC